MRTLIHKRYIIRQNLFTIIAVGLCFYFSWHALLGQRGYVNLISLERQVEKAESGYEAYKIRRQALEKQVVMLRPDSLDPDFLEERARYVLGYVKPGEQLVLVGGGRS